MAESSVHRIREVLRAAGSSPESLQKLIQHPEEFAKEAGLSEKEAHSLRGADLVIAVSRSPLAGWGIEGAQTTHPMTITVTSHKRAFASGDPPYLDQFDKVQLTNVLRQALVNPEYGLALRKALELR